MATNARLEALRILTAAGMINPGMPQQWNEGTLTQAGNAVLQLAGQIQAELQAEAQERQKAQEAQGQGPVQAAAHKEEST